MDQQSQLSRRERQIMDIVYARGQASASDVLDDMPDAPSRASVRTLLRILEEKGHLRHVKSGREFVYSPTRSVQTVARSAMRRVVSTFFGGSLEQAVASHLSDRSSKVSTDELNRLSDLIRQARERGR